MPTFIEIGGVPRKPLVDLTWNDPIAFICYLHRWRYGCRSEYSVDGTTGGRMVVQPATLYGVDTLLMTSSHVMKLEVAEIKMFRWACGHTLRSM